MQYLLTLHTRCTGAVRGRAWATRPRLPVVQGRGAGTLEGHKLPVNAPFPARLQNRYRKHAMSYMLLILEEPHQRQTRTVEEGHAVYQRMLTFGEDLHAKGLLVASESLSAHDQATRVQKRAGRAQVLDGPFSEAKEMVGGFFLLTCKTRDEAVEIAQACPAAEWATIEVRALGPCYA
jgi:hypothetical protein